MIFLETIGATSFEVYSGLAGVTAYLLGSSSAGAVAFRGLAHDDQVRRLNDATRYIDSYRWQGIATGLAGGTPTTLQFPRSGLTDLAGFPLDPTNVPGALLSAVGEMTAILAADQDAAAAVDAGSNLQSIGAGSARLQFFRPLSAQDGTATRLPQQVNQYIGRWLAGASTSFGGVITGTSSPGSDAFRRACSFCGGFGEFSGQCGCAEQRPDRSWPL